MPAGRAGYLHPNITAAESGNFAKRPLAALFDDGNTSVSGGTVAWSQLGYSGMPELDPEIESTWIPIVMHLADNSRRAASFDVAQQGYSSSYYAYKTFSFEGSLDGIHWDSLTNVTVSLGSSKWSFNKGDYSAGNSDTHADGCPIAGGPKGTANALEGVSSVSVAAGARLVAEGAATIPGLTIDATGAGTVEGFAFAENGTLAVKNMPKHGGVLPGTYENCTGLENVGNWTLKNADTGLDVRGGTVSVSNGKLYVIVPGFILLIK
jgi:hypothetical protein